MSSTTGYTLPLGYPLTVETPIGRASQLPISFFVDFVLPPLPGDLIIEPLVQGGTFRDAITIQGKLWGYTKKSPSGIHSKDTEKAFSHLARAIRAITRAVHLEDLSAMKYLNNKGGVATLEARTDDTLPDAYFLLDEDSVSDAPIHWTQIAAFGEYKREENAESTKENMDKVTYSMTKFSDPFNFITDYLNLICFVLCISYAKPDQIGRDSTMAPRTDDGKPQYDIQVRSSDGSCTLYRTLDVLSDSGAVRVVSRGTRVWKAVKIENGMPTGAPVALKDAWVDSSRHREGYIHSQVLQSNYLSKERPKFQRYFVTVQTHGDVFQGDEQDRTLDLDIVDTSTSTGGSGDEHASGSPHPHAAIKAGPHFQIHYRIIYGEVGEPLAETTSLRKVFMALMHTVQGIEIDSDAASDRCDRDRIAAQLELARELFYQRDKRISMMIYPAAFSNRIKDMHPRFWPIGRVLGEFYLLLHHAYRNAEKELDELTFDVAKDIYLDILALLKKAAALAGDIQVRRRVIPET
ncbi:hypothetical protein EIP86_001423 [Pleurotus ostreatoroseus]|nr:hypothetical protein EIP86_001423 [Pleurotus ostreatoroseus]